MTATDLIRLAELIKLAAETALAFSATKTNGERSTVTDAVERIIAAAEELVHAGQTWKQDPPDGL